MHSNLSNEMTEPKTVVARSLFHEKYNLKLGFCTVPISMNSDSTTHISSAVMELPLIYPQPLGENVALEVFNCSAQ